MARSGKRILSSPTQKFVNHRKNICLLIGCIPQGRSVYSLREEVSKAEGGRRTSNRNHSTLIFRHEL